MKIKINLLFLISSWSQADISEQLWYSKYIKHKFHLTILIDSDTNI
jgi:hypothetical protein